MNINLAIFHQCFKEKAATEFAIEQFLIHNENLRSKYYLVSDGGDDFSDIAKKYNINYYHEDNIGMKIMDGQTALRAIKRIIKLFEISKCNYLMLMEDDILCRGKLDYDHDFNAIGANSKGNLFDPDSLEYIADKYKITIKNNFFNLCGGSLLNKDIFFNRYDYIEHFLLNEHDYICTRSKKHDCNWQYGNWDSTISMLYTICEKEIGINEELTETWRDADWKTNKRKLVHWYKSKYINGKDYERYYINP